MQLLIIFTAFAGLANAKLNEFNEFAKTMHPGRFGLQNAYPTFPTNPKYATYLQFRDTTCTTVDQVVSFLLNTCLAGDSSSSVFTCVNGAIIQTDYNGLTCEGEYQTYYYSTSCSRGEDFSLKTIACDVSNPFDFPPGNYTTDVFSQDSSCTKTLVATGNPNNICYLSETGSYMVKYPYGYIYEDTTCSGAAQQVPYGGNFCNFTTGADDDDDDFAKDNSYESIVLVSVPEGSPAVSPTSAPTTLCEGTPCPTSCPEGYGAAQWYMASGCAVFCTAQPTHGQCQPGGSGCTSSCTPCAQLVSSMCPTSCPNGFMPGTERVNAVGCSVFCQEEPENGQCAVGGPGCTSSCYPADDSSPSSDLSAGAIAGIVVGGMAGLALVVTMVMWTMKIGFFAAKAPLSTQPAIEI